jgi:hypothetical protein
LHNEELFYDLFSSPNVDVKARKADSLLWARRRACGATWGLRPKVVHWLNISIIWPSITLASLIWWPDYQMINAKKRPRQRLACLGITGAMHTSPTGANGGTRWPPSTGAGDSGCGKVSCASSLKSDVGLPSPHSRTW